MKVKALRTLYYFMYASDPGEYGIYYLARNIGKKYDPYMLF